MAGKEFQYRLRQYVAFPVIVNGQYDPDLIIGSNTDGHPCWALIGISSAASGEEVPVIAFRKLLPENFPKGGCGCSSTPRALDPVSR